VFHIQTLQPKNNSKPATNQNQPTNKQTSEGCGLVQRASQCPLVIILIGTLNRNSEHHAASIIRAEKKKLLVGLVALYNKKTGWVIAVVNQQVGRC
jgi:hypothetical protein